MDQGDVEGGDEPGRPHALAALNNALGREGFEAFYGPDKKCHLPHRDEHGCSAKPAPAVYPSGNGTA